MAGKPGRSGGPRANSGGARPGAGRKPKEPEPTAERDPLQFLLDVMQGKVEASATQLRAAVAAVQYTHAKRGEGGKREEQADRAKKAATGKFAAAAPPLKLVRGG
jgi:hypothetical protein